MMSGELSLAIEWIMVGLEPFDGAHGARASRRLRVIGRGRTWRFGFGVGGFITDSFDAHICQGGIEIVEAGV